MIHICSEFADLTWDEEFMNELGAGSKQGCQLSDEEDDEDALQDLDPPPPRLKNFVEAMDCLEEVRSFLELSGHTAEATKAGELVNTVAWLQCSTTRYTNQAKLTSYFQPGTDQFEQ